MREETRRWLFGGDLREEQKQLRTLLWGIIPLGALAFGAMFAASFKVQEVTALVIYSSASFGIVGLFGTYLCLSTLLHFAGPWLSKFATAPTIHFKKDESGQLTVLNLIGFVIFLIALVALLPLLMTVIEQGASVGGPMVGLILFAVPIILVLVGVASLLRYTERPF